VKEQNFCNFLNDEHQTVRTFGCFKHNANAVARLAGKTYRMCEMHVEYYHAQPIYWEKHKA